MSLDKIGGIFCLCRLKEFFVGNKCRHTVFLQSNSLIFFFHHRGKKLRREWANHWNIWQLWGYLKHKVCSFVIGFVSGCRLGGDIMRNSFDEYKTDDLDQYVVSKCSSVFLMKVMYKKGVGGF